MTPLVREWIEDARESAEADPRDMIVYAEATDHRLGYPRQVVVGAIVDGVKRRGLPGVILSHLAEDDTGSFNECGAGRVLDGRTWDELPEVARG